MRIIRPTALELEVLRLYDQGLPPGDSTGWPSIDQFYTVAPGQLTVITGYPSSGKSEWLDALLMALSQKGWMFAIYSPENLPHELHLAKWLEKLHRLPFGAGPNARMSAAQVSNGLRILAKTFFHLAAPKAEDTAGLAEIMESAELVFDDDKASMSERKHGLVIDPWNELEHFRSRDVNESDYIRDCLTRLRGWARAHRVHVWLVAHPAKQRREDGKLPIPTPDSISGSAHFWNKADCAITIHRDLADKYTKDVDVHIQKCRFKNIGRQGLATLQYDRVTGLYSDRHGLHSVPEREVGSDDE